MTKAPGFKTSTNKITIIDHKLQKTTFKLKDKDAVATDICNKVVELIHEKELVYLLLSCFTLVIRLPRRI